MGPLYGRAQRVESGSTNVGRERGIVRTAHSTGGVSRIRRRTQTPKSVMESNQVHRALIGRRTVATRCVSSTVLTGCPVGCPSRRSTSERSPELLHVEDLSTSACGVPQLDGICAGSSIDQPARIVPSIHAPSLSVTTSPWRRERGSPLLCTRAIYRRCGGALHVPRNSRLDGSSWWLCDTQADLAD